MHSLKQHRCKFKIDQITYLKRSVEQCITFPKISLTSIPNMQERLKSNSKLWLHRKSSCYFIINIIVEKVIKILERMFDL